MSTKAFSSMVLAPLLSVLFPLQGPVLEAHAASGLNINPFSLQGCRLAPGTTFEVHIDKALLAENGVVDDSKYVQFTDQLQRMGLKYEVAEDGTPRMGKVHSLDYTLVQRDHELFFSVQMPRWSALMREGNDIRRQSPWRGWLKAYEAELTLAHPRLSGLRSFPVEIPDPHWGFVWGIAVVLLSFLVVRAVKPFPLKRRDEFEEDRSVDNWENTRRLRRFFLYPLNFAVTPIGTYSISLAQVLLWTYVTIFGIVYVHWLTGCFIDITEQILMLLGIGGGTALAAKVNAVSRVREIPDKYLNLIRRERIPRLKDLLTIEGQPSIYKFQMLAFTLLTAYIVVVEIVKNYAFPEIPNSLVLLMGISGGVYLGNELSQKNIWDEMRARVDAIEKFAKDSDRSISNAAEIRSLGIQEVDELIRMLQRVYT